MRYFYGFLACCMFGAMCGLTTGAAQVALRARAARDSAEDSAAYARARSTQADRNLNACIQLYADAERVEDHCQRKLMLCLGVLNK